MENLLQRICLQLITAEAVIEEMKQKTAEYLKTAVDSEGNRKQIEQNKKCNIRRNQTTAAGII